MTNAQPSPPPPTNLDEARATRRDRVAQRKEARADRIAERNAQLKEGDAAATRDEKSRDAFAHAVAGLLGRLANAVEGLTTQLRESATAAADVRAMEGRMATLERAASEANAQALIASKNPSAAFVTRDELEAALKAKKH